MGQIVITAWGSMNPEADQDKRTVEINHIGSYADTVYAARAALNAIEADLRAKIGDALYEAREVVAEATAAIAAEFDPTAAAASPEYPAGAPQPATDDGGTDAPPADGGDTTPKGETAPLPEAPAADAETTPAEDIAAAAAPIAAANLADLIGDGPAPSADASITVDATPMPERVPDDAAAEAPADAAAPAEAPTTDPAEPDAPAAS